MEVTRTYIQHKDGKNELLAWVQLRCVKCGRFLGLYRKKYCSKCAPKEYLKSKNTGRNKKRLHK
jgi:rRNA maturation endonuclease Nob1